jgi:hypothetical protein
MSETCLSPADNTQLESLTKPKKHVFFIRKPFERKRRLKTLVYQIYHCAQCKPSDDGTKDIGSWASLLIQQPQDSGSHYDTVQNTCMLSAEHLSGDKSHIRIRLDGIIESLVWITTNIKITKDDVVVVANIVSNDVFVVNSLREWIPKWEKTTYQISNSDEDKRPHSDLMAKIGSISTKIKLSVRWQSEKSYEMSLLARKVDNMLSSPDKSPKTS